MRSRTARSKRSADDETPRLGATMLRAIRDAGLGRALRAAHDELQGVLSLSDRHSSLLTNAPALIWSTDETLTLRGIEGAEAARTSVGVQIGDWDRCASSRRPRARRRRASRRTGRRNDHDSRAVGSAGCAISPSRRCIEGDSVAGTAGAALAIAASDVDISAHRPRSRSGDRSAQSRDLRTPREHGAARMRSDRRTRGGVVHRRRSLQDRQRSRRSCGRRYGVARDRAPAAAHDRRTGCDRALQRR